MRELLVAVAISALGGSLGCRSSSEPRVASAIAGLPDYTPEEATVFDDVLSAGIFGTRPDAPPEKDSNFPLRVRRADWVGRARVSTVSKETLAGKDGYTLALSPDGPAIAGNPPSNPVELRVPRGSPAFLRLETTPDSVVGKRVILFLRRYADRGEPANHWHGEADDPSIVAAIEHQKAIDAQGGQAQTKD